MHFSPFTREDLDYLKDFEPPGWGDLTPRFSKYLQSRQYEPAKLIVGEKMIAIGTAIYHSDTAWLATIIVHPGFRNYGYGKKITEHLINKIDRSKFRTVYLDATELGFPVYHKLGFVEELEYVHFKSSAPEINRTISNEVRFFKPSDKQQIFDLDRIVSGENRSAMLAEHLLSGSVYMEGKTLQGFYLPAFGDGLIIANTEQAGVELMKCRLLTRQIASCPTVNKAAIEFLETNGFEQCRISRRMFLGERRLWRPDKLFNRVSGQLG